MLKVVCEKGITFEFIEGRGWQLLSTKTPVTANDPMKAAAAYGVRPVLLAEDILNDGSRTLFLPSSPGKSPFELQPSDLTQLIFNRWNSPSLPHAVSMNYLLGAVVYHCKKLAEAYSQITQGYAKAVHLHNEQQPSDPSSEQFWAGNRVEPFYEFEAFIASVRRAYDSMRYIIWQALVSNKGSTPSSFPDTLKASTGLPDPLKARLYRSWAEFGEKATAYRDCILHYVPIGGGWSNVRVYRLSGGIWTCSVLLPDNPEARSIKKFTYNSNTDALSYSWELANEIVDVAHELISATPELRPWLDEIQPD